MVTSGTAFPDRALITPQEIAARTATALSRTMPPALVGVFVSPIFFYPIVLEWRTK